MIRRGLGDASSDAFDEAALLAVPLLAMPDFVLAAGPNFAESLVDFESDAGLSQYLRRRSAVIDRVVFVNLMENPVEFGAIAESYIPSQVEMNEIGNLLREVQRELADDPPRLQSCRHFERFTTVVTHDPSLRAMVSVIPA